MVNIVQKCSYPVNFKLSHRLIRDGRAVSLPSGEVHSLHYHNLCEVGLCRCGSGLWLVGDSVTAIHPGDAMLVPPGVSHYSRALDACFCEFVYFNADEFLRLNGINLTPELPADNVFHGEQAELLRNMIESDDPTESALWFALFLRRLPKPRRDSASDESLAPAILRITLSYAEELSVDMLAAECGFSKSWFIKRFYSVYHMTPMSYLNDFRTRVAAELLSGGLSITEAALRAGFNSPSDLYRHFRHKYGMSPSKFKSSRKDFLK